MREPRQQRRILAVLLVVLAGAIGWRVNQLGSVSTPSAQGGSRAPVLDRQLAQVDLPRLELEALRGEAASYSPGRDPFRFGAAPQPPTPPTPPVRRERPPRRRRPPAQQQATPVAAAQPARPRPPEIDFVYLGSFGPQERRLAVFVKNDEIFNAFVGDVLMERFIVDKIGFESADIKFVGFPDTPGKRLEAGG